MTRAAVALLLAVLAAGCGGGQSKMADKPTEDQVRQNEEEQKKVDEEERGPAGKKGR